MATDGPNPPPCKPEIFKNGVGLCIVDGSANAIERWVKKIAERANAEVDWHYSGGRANVLHLGDAESYRRALNAIRELKHELKGTILSICQPSLYRAGDAVSEDAIAVDPSLGAIIKSGS